MIKARSLLKSDFMPNKTTVALYAPLIGVLMALSMPAMAQQPAPNPAPTTNPTAPNSVPTKDPLDKARLDKMQQEANELAEDAVEDAEEEEEEDRESAHGSHAWQLSYGGGLEAGLFFSQLGRWNTQLLEPNGKTQFDTDVLMNLDFALEVSPLEGGRFTLFGGLQGPFSDDPSISAMYIGLEPAFAFRRDAWELALGVGVGVGGVDMTLDSGESVSAGLLLLRPFIEARTYASEWMAAYLRFGFNYWNVRDPEFTGLSFNNSIGALNQANLDEGGAYLALGLRFGHYPDQTKNIPDSDGDGLRDDIDDCVDEPEDMDGFKDKDGCPEVDNDGDGILDTADKCPNEPEDKDGWEDGDGCPELNDDTDGDGLVGEDDKCPTEPEDKDGFQDEDGCPDPDNDGDGILDVNDRCPKDAEDKDGFNDEDGCPDPDNDFDKVLDADDKCPNEFGVVERQGCPVPDRDGDGIPDDQDKCPDKPETFNGNKDEDGCPDGKETVVITEKEIKVLEKVYFDVNADTIQPKSFPLLDTVAIVLNRNPQISKIRVEGHTDDQGKDEYNLELSKRRAAAVKTYLQNKEVNVDRLESEGYGESAPVCTEMAELLKNAKKNGKKIEECRANNRRVGFKILSINGKPVDAASSVIIKETKVVEEPIPETPEAK